MKISEKRKAGEVLERGGISQRIILLAQDIAEGSYKNAIEKAGQISVLVEAATYDSYWEEKANKGKYNEQDIFEMLNDGAITRDKAICYT
ncbi:MAG: hypothetical protein OEY89_14135 [Gammaproteobacteria bacterium]|nr:hypothetical protein [Gammaproteobacteria bacterium]